MRAKHPPYPLLAGAPEERRALAAYLETLIAKSGRTLASRPEPPPVEPEPAAPPAMVSKPSPGDAEERSENLEAGKPEAVEKDPAVPVLPPPGASQGLKMGQEANVPEKEGRSLDSPAPPDDSQDVEKPEEKSSP